MLEPVPLPQSVDERFAALFDHRNVVARCPECNATLKSSRKQWTLVYGSETRQKMPLSERVFDCPCCSAHLDRDLNAALNIRGLGL